MRKARRDLQYKKKGPEVHSHTAKDIRSPRYRNPDDRRTYSRKDVVQRTRREIEREGN